MIGADNKTACFSGLNGIWVQARKREEEGLVECKQRYIQFKGDDTALGSTGDRCSARVKRYTSQQEVFPSTG